MPELSALCSGPGAEGGSLVLPLVLAETVLGAHEGAVEQARRGGVDEAARVGRPRVVHLHTERHRVTIS
jgi:hypothetical protein